MRTERGFTLTEVMITVAIIGIIGSLTATLYMQLYKSYAQVEVKTKVTQVATATIGSLQKQLREITQRPAMTQATTLHPTSTTPITFYIPSLTNPADRASDDRVVYYNGTYNGKNVLLQKLIRGATTYTAIPVLFDFDNYRTNPALVPQAGGIVAFLSNDTTMKYDDAAFYFDDTYNMICVGITVSAENKGRKGQRCTLTLSCSIAIRNTYD
jgi:prepilin-type N-terminal cleavage/methylation domain-containing protein